MSALAESNISVVGDVFIKQMVFPQVGDFAMTHAHRYDHQTLLATGAVAVMVHGQNTNYTAPAIIVIRAGAPHSLLSLADGTVVYCIHAIRNGDCLDEAEPLVEGMENRDVPVVL